MHTFYINQWLRDSTRFQHVSAVGSATEGTNVGDEHCTEGEPEEGYRPSVVDEGRRVILRRHDGNIMVAGYV